MKRRRSPGKSRSIHKLTIMKDETKKGNCLLLRWFLCYTGRSGKNNGAKITQKASIVDILSVHIFFAHPKCSAKCNSQVSTRQRLRSWHPVASGPVLLHLAHLCGFTFHCFFFLDWFWFLTSLLKKKPAPQTAKPPVSASAKPSPIMAAMPVSTLGIQLPKEPSLNAIPGKGMQ